MKTSGNLKNLVKMGTCLEDAFFKFDHFWSMLLFHPQAFLSRLGKPQKESMPAVTASSSWIFLFFAPGDVQVAAFFQKVQ